MVIPTLLSYSPWVRKNLEINRRPERLQADPKIVQLTDTSITMES